MKLNSLKLRNFRNYRQLTEISIGDLTCLIGKNDIGKSTILEALNCFFNDDIDKSDLSINAEDSTIEISCTFDEFDDNIVLDSSVPTSLKTESMLNELGYLEIKKVFKIGGTISKATYLHCHHESDASLTSILSLKIRR